MEPLMTFEIGASWVVLQMDIATDRKEILNESPTSDQSATKAAFVLEREAKSASAGQELYFQVHPDPKQNTIGRLVEARRDVCLKAPNAPTGAKGQIEAVAAFGKCAASDYLEFLDDGKSTGFVVKRVASKRCLRMSAANGVQAASWTMCTPASTRLMWMSRRAKLQSRLIEHNTLCVGPSPEFREGSGSGSLELVSCENDAPDWNYNFADRRWRMAAAKLPSSEVGLSTARQANELCMQAVGSDGIKVSSCLAVSNRDGSFAVSPTGQLMHEASGKCVVVSSSSSSLTLARASQMKSANGSPRLLCSLTSRVTSEAGPVVFKKKSGVDRCVRGSDIANVVFSDAATPVGIAPGACL
jgi:hypothetical protein